MPKQHSHLSLRHRLQVRPCHQQHFFPVTLFTGRFLFWTMIPNICNYGQKHCMFVLNLACLFLWVARHCCNSVQLLHKTYGGWRGSGYRWNTTNAATFTPSVHKQMLAKATGWVFDTEFHVCFLQSIVIFPYPGLSNINAPNSVQITLQKCVQGPLFMYLFLMSVPALTWPDLTSWNIPLSPFHPLSGRSLLFPISSSHWIQQTQHKLASAPLLPLRLPFITSPHLPPQWV